MLPQELPQELIDYVVDFLYDDRECLANISVLNQAWLEASRYHLFSHITISLHRSVTSGGALEEPLRSFQSLVASSAHSVGRLIRVLRIEGGMQSISGALLFARSIYIEAQAIIDLISALPNLSELSLFHFALRISAPIKSSTLISLKTLSLDTISSDILPDSHASALSTFLRHFNSIDNLDFLLRGGRLNWDGISNEGVGFLHVSRLRVGFIRLIRERDAAYDLLSHTVALPSLESIDISLAMSEEELNSAATTILSKCHNLKKITVSLETSIAAELTRWEPLSDSLVSLPSLQILEWHVFAWTNEGHPLTDLHIRILRMFATQFMASLTNLQVLKTIMIHIECRDRREIAPSTIKQIMSTLNSFPWARIHSSFALLPKSVEECFVNVTFQKGLRSAGEEDTKAMAESKTFIGNVLRAPNIRPEVRFYYV